jgi:lysophospholipase L1-like esterase
VALGGSTTYTIEVKDNEKTFTRQLENILRANFSYENIEVINAGVGGYNSWESLINLQFRVLDLSPDLIIIYNGTNDVHTRLVSLGSYKGDNSGRRRQWSAPRVPLLVKHSYLLRVVSSKLGWGLFRREGLGSFVDAPTFRGALSGNPSVDPMLLLEKNPPTYFKRNLTNMVAIARAHGVEVLLSTWAHSPYFGDYASTPHYQRGFQENNSVIGDVARERGITLFDFAQKMPKDKKYWRDGRHVNEEGALVKAKLFADFIHGSGFLTPTNNAEGE